jgi:beta-lactamase regulating signal transducer with metallopeptidase domain
VTLRLVSGAWLIISIFLIARVTLSYRYIKRVKRSCVPVESHWVAPLRKWAGVQTDSRSARIALTPEIRMPMAIGLTAPLVALPEQLSHGLPEDELDQVILHELGHIQRWDDWANLIQKLIEALLFFNPAVLWI